MKLLKYISALFIASIIFVGSIGMYVIKDTCAPCGETAMITQMVLSEYETNCNEQEDICCGAEEKKCCSSEESEEHEHEHNTIFFQNAPEFFQLNTIANFKPITYLIAVIVSQPEITGGGFNAKYKEYIYKDIRGSVSHTLSLLCTYLI